MRDRAQELFNALKNLVKKLDKVNNSEEYKGVWSLYNVHGGKYTGPQYRNELNNARKLVEDIDNEI